MRHRLRHSGWWFLAVPVLLCADSQTPADLFDDSTLHEIQVRMDPADWQAIHDNYLDNTYYRCEFAWRSMVLPNVGVRSRGSGTRNATKPSLGFDFSKYTSSQRFLGLKSLVTRNFAHDESMIHEHLAMKLFARMGLNYQRTSHARIYVNGEYAGVYLLVEPVDSRYLRLRFGEDTGFLYEFNWNGNPYHFEYLGDDPALYLPNLFEPKTHEDSPQPEQLIAMIRDINQAADSEFQATLSQYLDLKVFLTHVAIEQFLSEFDGLLGFAGMANFYLYRRTADNKWQFIVWDKDNTFHDTSRPIWENTEQNVLIRRALQVPALREHYLEALHLAAESTGGNQGWLHQEAQRAYWLIQQAAHEDPVKVMLSPSGIGVVPATNEDFEFAHIYLNDFFAFRAGNVAAAVQSSGYFQSAAAPDLCQPAASNLAYEPSALTPGSLARIHMTTPLALTIKATSFPLPLDLDGVSITIAGKPAPLLSVAPTEAVFQVPLETPCGIQPLQVNLNGVRSHVICAEVRPSSPGILSVSHADWSLVESRNPAWPGEYIILFATGAGMPETKLVDGVAVPVDPLLRVKATVAAIVDGAAITVDYAGMAPNLAGLQQIIFRWPDIPAGRGSVRLSLSADGEIGNTVEVPTR
ncbi:MAG: CotH kinase family protein [Bryobacteraceae bacterium]